VEALFCTIPDILRYDTILLTEAEVSQQKTKASSTVSSIRMYYGPTLGHLSPLSRRLAGQTFGLFLRKFHAIQKHIQHTLLAYITSISHQQHMVSSLSSHSTAVATTAISNSRRRVTGHTGLVCYFHTRFPADFQSTLKLCNHMNPSYFTPIWGLFHTLQHILEQKHQQQRKQVILKYIIVTALESKFVATKTTTPAPLLTSTTITNSYNHELKEGMLRLVCTLWKARPTSLMFLKRIPPLLLQLLQPNELCETTSHTNQNSDGHSILFDLAKHLLPHLPIHISLTTLVPTILQASLLVVETSQTKSFLMSLVLFPNLRLISAQINHPSLVQCSNTIQKSSFMPSSKTFFKSGKKYRLTSRSAIALRSPTLFVD
jgi:hypothetical protein